MSQMKLKSFNYFVGLLIIFLYSPLLSEEKIDIWKNKKEIITDSPKQEKKNNQDKPDLLSSRLFKQLKKFKSKKVPKFKQKNK